MRMSMLLGRTLREAPSEADALAYQLVLRAGLARPLLAGGMALLPLGMRVLRQIEQIIHEEMAHIDGQEFRTPVIQSAALWEQSGRLSLYGPAMIRMQNRAEQALIVAPTHEEAVAEVARRELESYRQLPALIYQVHTKYRDELRVRNGLFRLREFTMLDAYSLSLDAADLDAIYAAVDGAFRRMFERCGVAFVAVKAATGEMGGSEACEFMALSDAGEDTIIVCPTCGYAANREIATAAQPTAWSGTAAAVERVHTPGSTTIAQLAELLDVSAAATAKAVFFSTPEHGLVFVVVRGDREVNPVKLMALIGASALDAATAEQIAGAGAVAGYASPVGIGDVLVVADTGVTVAGPLIAGANQTDWHLRNVLYGRDWQAAIVGDIVDVHAGDRCSGCGSALRAERAIEIGHIFKLGTRYTEALGATVLSAEGVEQPVVMGSYGIGLERLLQVIIDQHHDEAGIVWPQAVAPYLIHVVALGSKASVVEVAESVHQRLQQVGLPCLYDDRAETAGVKFNDADLIGIPLRIVLSERGLKQSTVEIKDRATGAVEHVQLTELEAHITALLAERSVQDAAKLT